jgi:polyphosphate kinase 2 (PPK2 family)
MAGKIITPVLGRDYNVLDNGALVVARSCSHLRAPYVSEPIPHYLSAVDHDLALKKKEYEKALAAEEREFNRLVRGPLADSKRSLIVVFQGRDAAGKSGACTRLEEALWHDHKIFLSVPIGAPTEEERAHPYLWRFFKGERMPQFGQVRVFDRSWAERLLVERVKKLAPREDLERSYAEIRAFEWILEQQGAVLVKIWMDITKDEQWRRFLERKEDKLEKLSESDYEARKDWGKYTRFANEMFHRTGTDFAPWYIVSSEDKRYSRVTVLRVINQALRAATTR